jgi:hypothetical protein
MLIDSKPNITGVIYSEITKELTVKYNDGNVEKWMNVPKEVYESIVNNGKVMSDYLKESLDTNYKKINLI